MPNEAAAVDWDKRSCEPSIDSYNWQVDEDECLTKQVNKQGRTFYMSLSSPETLGPLTLLYRLMWGIAWVLSSWFLCI